MPEDQPRAGHTAIECRLYFTDFALHGRAELHRTVCLGRPATACGTSWDRVSGLTSKNSGEGNVPTGTDPRARMPPCPRTRMDVLVAQASLALDEHVSVHPALRASTMAAVNSAPLAR